MALLYRNGIEIVLVIYQIPHVFDNGRSMCVETLTNIPCVIHTYLYIVDGDK